MRFLIAPDTFKGTLSAARVAEIVGKTVRAEVPGSEVDLLPMADGGEGTIDAIIRACGGTLRKVKVHDPLLRPVEASYLVIDESDAREDGADSTGAPAHATAIIEMAEASGLTLLRQDERNPRVTSSFGAGELIADAIRQGYGRILVALGGSATVDGGAGALAALGMQFTDDKAEPFVPTGGTLSRIEDMDPSGLLKPKRGTQIIVLRDVDNPLLGADGAALTFGSQKFGNASDATSETLLELEEGMRYYAAIAESLTATQLYIDPYTEKGAGAAGGLGYALALFLGAKMEPGVEVIAGLVGLEERLAQADTVITGEGRVDAQTAHGKTVWGVAQAAWKRGVPCYVVAGSVEEGVLADFGTMPGSFAELADGDAPSLLDVLDEEPQVALFELEESEDDTDRSLFGGSGLIAAMEVASDRTMDEEYALAHAEELLRAATARLLSKMDAGR